MKDNKRLKFLKSIQLSLDEKNSESTQETHISQAHKITRREEINLQKELEKRFNELFGTSEED